MTRTDPEAPLVLLPETGAAVPARLLWAANRFRMETENRKSRRYGGKGPHHWYALLFLMRTFDVLLKWTRQHERGVGNAWDIAVREMDVELEQLPAAFDGFTVLHLSDLHLDGMPGLEQAILERLGAREFDLCVLTGDYRTELHGPIRPTMDRLRPLVSGVRSRHGVLGVLGNHDDCHMVEPMEAMGIRMLVNEGVRLARGEDVLQVIGTDDVHYYFTDQAVHALEAARSHFTIALVHSPEAFDVAADLGVDLYLCGHTHAGQVCLPGGRPVIKHLSRGRRFYRGAWKHRDMVGITNAGAGTSGVPVRFNTRGEILTLTLRCPPTGSRPSPAARP